MIRHLVLLRWNSPVGATELAEIENQLVVLPRRIPEIKSFHCGENLDLDAGNYDFAIVADFADIEGYEVYRDHPCHQSVLRETLRPRLDSRVAIQFDIGSTRDETDPS